MPIAAKSAPSKGKSQVKGTKPVAVSLNTIRKANRAPEAVLKGKARGFGSGTKDLNSTRAVAIQLFTVLTELRSWAFDAKTGVATGAKAITHIAELKRLGKSTAEANVIIHKLYVEMGAVRNAHIDSLKERGIRITDGSAYDVVAELLGLSK